MASSCHPTPLQLREAREKLREQQNEADEIQRKIDAEERALEDAIAQRRRAIGTLRNEKRRVEDNIQFTKEFLSPIRRLPDDLLRHIFWNDFEENPFCAWTIAAVCSTWRRLVLNMPRMWSKIRLVTTPNTSPEIIRLWLERSGSLVPLDIEIYLHVPAPPRKRRRTATPIPWSPVPATDAFYPAPPTPPLPYEAPPLPPPPAPHHVQLGLHVTIPQLPQPPTSHIHAVYVDQTWRSMNRGKNSNPLSSSWGHIAIYYLAEQMHRWKRFVFRFDRPFESMGALRNVSRDAPLLEEFEVSCGEPLRSDTDIYPYDWAWLPSTDRNSDVRLQNIRSVTLQYVPFRWSSPLISANLRSINIRSISTPGIGGNSSTQMTLDRLLRIIAANPGLEHLSLHFQNAQPPVLPLEQTRLTELKSLSLGGSFTLAPLLDALITPSLDSLTLNIDREAPEEAISALLMRSNKPPISFLSLAFQSPVVVGPYFGDGPGLLPWSFLESVPHVRTLQIGCTSLDVLMDALATYDDDVHHGWLVPHLEHLALRNCHAHGDSVAKLVALVEARNPASASMLVNLNGTGAGAGNGTGAGAGANAVAGSSMVVHAAAPPSVSANANVGPILGIGQSVMLEDIVPMSVVMTPMPTPPATAGSPAHGGTIPPAKLKSLELHDCATLGEDIVRWLRNRILDVKIGEPSSNRPPRSPHPHYYQTHIDL